MQLLPDEIIEQDLRPHWAARLDGGVFYFWLFFLGLGLFLGKERLYAWAASPTIHSPTIDALATFLHWTPYPILWSVLILIPALIKALAEAKQSIFWFSLILCGGLRLASHEFNDFVHLDNRGLLGTGLVLLVWHGMKTGGIRYVVTNRRIMILSGFFGGSERALLYDRIQDIVLQRSFMGKMCGYGTVVPITSSQLGMGQSNASVSVGAGGAVGPVAGGGAVTFGQGRNTVFADWTTALHCIPHSQEAYNTIMQHMTGHAS